MIEASAETSWRTLRLRRVAMLVTDKATSSSFDIALENIESGTGRLIESEGEFSTEGVAFQPGDLLFGKLRPYLAKAWVADREGAAVGDFHVLRPQAAVDPKFLRYSVLGQQFLNEVNSSTFGAKMPRVSWEFLASMKLALPSYDQQLRIVRYLDRETAEIDALIEKQERLIALLAEKRQAFISHAVTKGLDPTAPMKDSGIPWVGLIPAHWELQKLRTLVTIEKRIAGTLGYDVFSITQRGLKVKDLDSADGQHSMDYSKYQIVEPADFAMNHMDLLTGYVDIAQSQGVTSPDYRVFRLKPSSSVLARFLLLVLQDAYRRRVLYAFGQGSSNLGRWRLPSEAFYGFPVALPSQSEQLEIVSEVARFEDDTEKLVSACRKAAHVLRERRASLISAAVTGKIDVTGRV